MSNSWQDSSVPSFQRWLEADPGPVAWVDAQARFGAVNRRFAEWFGVNADDLVGQPRATMLSRLLTPMADDAGAYDPLLLADPPLRAVTVRLAPRAGETDGWRYVSVALTDDDDQVLGWRDCLEPPGMTAALAAGEEQRLADRDRLAARVSHELRTPMTAVIGFCHMLLEYSNPLDNSQRSYVQKILRNASILLQLLNNVLDTASLREGGLSVCWELIDPEVLMVDAASAVEPQHCEKDLDLDVHVDADLPDFYSDRLKLKQILINLLSNAVKYTERGGVQVDARLVGESVEIRVTDTGSGIAPDQLERVFEPYVQVPGAAAASKTPSTGLGLSIARAMAELLGGTLTAESTLGRGSTFTLRLPLHMTLPEVSPPSAPTPA
ncbi:MAG: HAMP domain-containing histidine kinase [Armatimonadetes bacterium]|nr:HAMP domain-containing histidine kinase [Armatimonadota bacterium]